MSNDQQVETLGNEFDVTLNLRVIEAVAPEVNGPFMIVKGVILGQVTAESDDQTTIDTLTTRGLTLSNILELIDETTYRRMKRAPIAIEATVIRPSDTPAGS